MLVEYKPFEPAFYATDIADWGMSYIYSKHCGPRAKVLVDTGHHYQAQNIEQIVAWLLSEDMLGGFHFNDRRYADDDLTLGCMDPYQVFRIFHEICYLHMGDRPGAGHRLHGGPEPQPEEQDRGDDPDVEQRAGIVPEGGAGGSREAGARSRRKANWWMPRNACARRSSPTCGRMLREWRESKGLAEDPLAAFRESGYLQKAEKDRAVRNRGAVGSYA